MQPRTRRILGLLSDSAVALALEACAQSTQTAKDLGELTGATPTSMKQKAELLEAYGLLEAGPTLLSGGRPAASWKAASSKELRDFSRQADAFAKALARSTERMLDEPEGAQHLRIVKD
jgi:predicted ArsR family transcriptional regulator